MLPQEYQFFTKMSKYFKQNKLFKIFQFHFQFQPDKKLLNIARNTTFCQKLAFKRLHQGSNYAGHDRKMRVNFKFCGSDILLKEDICDPLQTQTFNFEQKYFPYHVLRRLTCATLKTYKRV